MKMKKTNVHRLLDKENIHYIRHRYSWTEEELDAESAAEQPEIPLQQTYKTLVAVGDKTGPVVACIGAGEALDLKALARVSGNKRVVMLPLKDLQKVTGYQRGGCSPLGMKKKYPTYLDSKAKAFGTIVVSAGKRGMQVELSPIDLQKLTGAALIPITRKKK